jgi:hypothetical protein
MLLHTVAPKNQLFQDETLTFSNVAIFLGAY